MVTSALAAFQQRRELTLEYLKSSTDDLRAHTMPHPAFGVLDGYQWLLFLPAHTERHALQIAEIQAHRDYPRPRLA
jgi:hypothetical protein